MKLTNQQRELIRCAIEQKYIKPIKMGDHVYISLGDYLLIREIQKGL